MADSLNPKNINELSEEQIINLFAESRHRDHGIGIGDDCSVTDGPNGVKQLVSTDLVIEQVHFRREDISPRALGSKALAVNLSDIAAMGGIPKGFYLSLALPKDLSAHWLTRFRDGLLVLAQRHNISLLGGDTTRSQNDIVISITITGTVKPKHLKLRSMAEPGDVLCVTGSLGDSAAGFKVLSHPDRYSYLSDANRKQLVEHHQEPKPEVAKGKWLAQMEAVHAMIDLSDGLIRDSRHIASQSRCGVDITLDRLPLSAPFKAFHRAQIEQAQDFAAAGGEDYKLLLAIAADDLEEIQKKFKQKFNTPLHQIGTMKKGEPQLRTLRDGAPIKLEEQQFKHFKGS
ncbi:thiamine-phosphate kinase [Fodinibius halophilus]|uniref:Thiamine-monophosphate kinase n=1 Tax=Fodinibius halophilus TaxID=1736908 RepID=A0A6M1TJ10_9BACT|nr:thiamine-phosphate kinase [Fodinibius halophilus]NGP88600.1 thiamine-phosphate kinase [Fodinibius halophilus]